MLENTVVAISEVLSYAIRALLLKDHSSEYVRIEPYLSRAKGLFHSFYPDKDIAEIGVSEAIQRLDTLCTQTSPRTRRQPKPIQVSRPVDLKTVHDLQKNLLVIARECGKFQEQHLTCIPSARPIWLSEKLEAILNEQKKNLGREIFLVRYLAMVAETSFQHDVHPVMIGISRLVYDFSSSELIEILDTYPFINGWGRTLSNESITKSLSRGKLLLMKWLEGRFGQVIQREGTQNTQSAQFLREETCDSKTFETVIETLKLFSHWGLDEVFQKSLDQATIKFKPHLKSELQEAVSQTPFGRGFIWVHPDIFQRIVCKNEQELQRKLKIPKFLDTSNPASTGGSTVPTPTSPSLQSSTPSPQKGARFSQPFEVDVDVPKLFQTLDAERERRRQFRGTVLKLVVDGIEIGHIQETEKCVCEIPGEPQTRTIQLHAHDGDGNFPLATVVLDPSDKCQTFSRTVENGWIATISTRPVSDETLALEIEYALATASEPVGSWAWGTSLKVGTAVLAIVVLVLTYFWLWKPKGEEDRVRQLPPPPPAPTQPQPDSTVPETPPKTPESPKQAHHPKKPDIPKPKPVVPPAPKIRYAVPNDGELAHTYNQSFLDEIAQVGFPVAAHQGEGVFSCSKELLLNSGSGESESFIIKLTAPDGRLIYSKAETITKENVDQAARATARKFLEQLKK